MRQQTADHRRQLQVELEDTDKRIARWTAAFESGDMPADLGTDRVRELKARRQELVATLGKVIPIRPPPESIFSDANVQRFRTSLREVFLTGDNALTRNYLRFLVEKITINDADVRIEGRVNALVQELTGAGRGVAALTTANDSPTTVPDWLRLLDSFRTLCLAPDEGTRSLFGNLNALASVG